uniref:Uncharacterized protein n=1 Tax=Oryza brachyantha TaxID=4533 RepID=J3L9L8_ORYBR
MKTGQKGVKLLRYQVPFKSSGLVFSCSCQAQDFSPSFFFLRKHRCVRSSSGPIRASSVMDVLATLQSTRYLYSFFIQQPLGYQIFIADIE